MSTTTSFIRLKEHGVVIAVVVAVISPLSSSSLWVQVVRSSLNIAFSSIAYRLTAEDQRFDSF